MYLAFQKKEGGIKEEIQKGKKIANVLLCEILKKKNKVFQSIFQFYY